MDKFIARLKRSWKSMTIWFNGTGIVLLQVLVTQPDLQQYLSVHDLSILIVMGNAILRFKTNSDLASK